MPDTTIIRRNDYCRTIIRNANNGFNLLLLTFLILCLIIFIIMLYHSISESNWRIGIIIILFIAITLTYLNVGVWLHEQLHYWGLRNLDKNHKAKIVYCRRNILILSGYYRVIGCLDYNRIVQSLLGPIYIPLATIIIGVIGNILLPAWWLPVMMIISIFGLYDMKTDLFWYFQIRNINTKGKYWDKGKELHVVWKEK